MKTNQVKFSADGTQFQIIFKTGAESDYFTSKEAGFKAITDLAGKNKIDIADFNTMRDQILEAKKLPWSKAGKQSRRRSPFHGMGFLMAMLLMDSIKEIDDSLFAPDEPVKVAYFKMCQCGGLHGRIYCKEGFTSRLVSQKDANEVLEKLKAEIEQSGLPVELKEEVVDIN